MNHLDNSPATTQASHSTRRAKRRIGLAAIALAATALFATGVSAQFVTSRAKGDDHFKIYLSTDPTAPGVLMSQAAGWNLQNESNFYLYGTAQDYYVHVWLQDVGGGISGFMGDFKITDDPYNPRQCTFDNNRKRLNTNTTHWRSTASLPQSTVWVAVPGSFGGGGDLAFNNSLPTNFTTPTLVPIDQGVNTAGGSPWTYYLNTINPAARYINDPANDAAPGHEAWFVTHIKCQ